MTVKTRLKDDLRKHWLLYLCLAVYLITAMSLYAFTTSPLYPNDYGYDSAMFRLIGSFILKGKTPYIDIWDHKGPVLYFIQALGAIRGTNNGKISFIYLMQQVSMFFSVILLERVDRLINPAGGWKKRLRFFILVVFAVTYLCFVVDGGNLSEDWSFPMICCSLYLFAKYALLSGKNGQHSPRFAFIHGICFSLIALMRINNAISICMGLLVIGINLIVHRQWKNLIQNILFGLLGIGIIAVPVFMFYYSRHALNDMLYASFIFNIKYSAKRSFKIYQEADNIIRFTPIVLSYFLIIIHCIKAKHIHFLDAIAAAVVTGNAIILLWNGVFPHYYMILFPVYLFVMILYLNFSKSDILEILLCLVFFGFCVSKCIETGKVYFRPVHNPVFPTVNLYLPKSERDSAIAVGVPPEIYLQTGITPCSRFVANQGSLFGIEPEFYKEFVNDIQTKNPKWIITSCDKKDQLSFIANLIEADYEYRFGDVPYCFYRLTEP